MKAHLTIFLAFFSLINTSAHNRDYLHRYDYTNVYQQVECYEAPRTASMEEVTKKLLSFGNNQHEKAYALYLWLALKVDYDYSYSRYYAQETFDHRSGVCNGFSLLFVKMCELAGIETKKITGLAKGLGYDSRLHYNDNERKHINSNHAWNGIKLYGKWYLVEATWASCLRSPKHIAKYWLADPHLFAYDHLPLNSNYNYDLKEWYYSENFEEQYSDNPINYKEFARVDDDTMQEYVFYEAENDEDYDPHTDNNLTRAGLSPSDFDALNEFDRLIKTKALPYIEVRGSELFLEFKDYYISGRLQEDFNDLKDRTLECWNSEEMEIIKDKSKDLLIEGLENISNWLEE